MQLAQNNLQINSNNNYNYDNDFNNNNYNNIREYDVRLCTLYPW